MRRKSMPITRFAGKGWRLFGVVALAASVATAAELELNVTGNQTLSQALAALSPALTISDINGGSYAAYDIVKTGSGTLTFDTELPNWTGSLGVTNGVVVAIPVAQTVLGSASGAVWVSSGTTIVIDDSDGASRANNSLAPKRPIHLAGTGAPGYYGAIKIINNVSRYRSCLPYSLVLEADTTMCFGNVDHKDAVNFVLDTSGGAKTIDQQGKYVLTLTKQGATRVPKFLWSGGNFVNPYRIVHDGVYFDNRGSSFSGSSANIVTLRNGANLIYEDNAGQPWTLIVEDTAGKLDINTGNNYEVTTARRMWNGPVTLEKSLNVSIGGAAVTNSVGFAGKVSGIGGFNSSVATGKKYWFFLMNPDNDFTGGVALTNLTLCVGAATAIPSGEGAGPLELKDSRVALYNGLSSFAFPDTTFIGTGSVVGPSDRAAAGTVRSLTKKGSGTLSVDAHLTADDVTLGGGTLSLPSGIRRRFAGLYHGKFKVPDSHSSVWGNALTEPDLQYTMSNTVVTTMPQFYHVSQYPAPGASASAWTSVLDTYWSSTFYHQYCTYDGFIWNNSPTTETWSVVCTLNAYTYMTINGTEYNQNQVTDGRTYGGNSGTPPDTHAVGKLWSVTVLPGPNPFRLRQYHRWNSPCTWYGNICTNLPGGIPFTYWEDGNGLMVDKKGRGTTDMRNYERMEDPGDGSLFTYEDLGDTDFSHSFQTVRGQGGTLDLNGGVAYAGVVEGTPNVVNGTLKVDGPGGAAASLELGEGTFALPSEADLRQRAAGLYVGSVTSTTRTQPAYTDCITYTNGVAYELDYFYTAPSKWGNYPYVTYDGYLWNTTGVDQVWTVMSVQDGKVKFSINGEFYSNTGQWDGCWTKPDLARAMWTGVTVRPGANRFTLYSAAQYVVQGQYVGNICTNGIDWTSDFGLAYDPQNRGSTDYRDYKKFETPRDGSLFTRTADFSLSYGTVSGVAGSVLDLGGRNDFVVPALEGVVVASNGTLTVTNSWTLTAAQVMSPAAVAEGVVFAPGTVFSMTASEIAQMVKTQTGYVVARNWSGTVPVTADSTRSAGWVLRERDGDLKVVRETGFIVTFR